MALFNCTAFENEDSVDFEVTTQTNDLDTGELAVEGSLKIKGVNGVSVAVSGDTVVFGIDSEMFPEDPEGGGDTTELEKRVAEIERDHTDNTNAVNYIMGLAQNPANDGKVYGIKDEEIIPIDLPDSIEINEVSIPEEIPADAKEGSVWVVPKQGGGESGGESGGDTLTLAKQYTDEQIAKFWTDAEVIDFTTMFDLSESVAAGGEQIGVQTVLAESIMKKMQGGPVKIKVSFDGLTATEVVHVQDFGTYCQLTDFVLLNGALIYLYIMVYGEFELISFKAQQVVTTPYMPS